MSWDDFFLTGGMPSTHSAFVISLVTILYLTEGVSSTFVVSLVLAVIVLRDASGVRRTVGEEGMVITQMMKVKDASENSFFYGAHPFTSTCRFSYRFYCSMGSILFGLKLFFLHNFYIT